MYDVRSWRFGRRKVGGTPVTADSGAASATGAGGRTTSGGDQADAMALMGTTDTSRRTLVVLDQVSSGRDWWSVRCTLLLGCFRVGRLAQRFEQRCRARSRSAQWRRAERRPDRSVSMTSQTQGDAGDDRYGDERDSERNENVVLVTRSSVSARCLPATIEILSFSLCFITLQFSWCKTTYNVKP